MGIKVPTDVELQCSNYFEIYQMLMERGAREEVIRCKDSHSKVVKKVIDIIGFDALNMYTINSLDDLFVVIEGLLESQDSHSN